MRAAATQTALGVFSIVQGSGQGLSISRASAGVLTISIPDSYPNLIGASVMIQRSSGAVDLVAQIASADVSTAKTVVIRTLAGAVPTDTANGDVLYISLDMRNSQGN